MMGVMVVMITLDADAADVMMVSRLRRPDIVFVTDDLRAIFAELAIHRRLAFLELGDALAECLQHPLVITKIERLDELDLRKPGRDGIGVCVDAFD